MGQVFYLPCCFLNICMNYKKLDAALAMAVNQVENPQVPSFVVFIRTNLPLDNTALAFLESLGIKGVTQANEVFTATVSVSAISQLSEQSWVQFLQLSQKLRLVNYQ
jgi:hypothetical protein